jgi:hypothetical protein
MASESTDGDDYQVLLILTDGGVADMAETIDAIIEASTQPMSIIIVGIGAGDFKNMELLDCDGGRISREDRAAARDIVQVGDLSGPD